MSESWESLCLNPGEIYMSWEGLLRVVTGSAWEKWPIVVCAEPLQSEGGSVYLESVYDVCDSVAC